MLSAEGRQVLQEIFDSLASILDCLYSPFQVDGVPENDKRRSPDLDQRRGSVGSQVRFLRPDGVWLTTP